MAQLILGSAQFGDSYGVTNASGRLPDDTVVEILQLAHRSGVELIDTSPAYGDAQHRLRALRPRRVSPPGYISKITLAPDADSAPSIGSVAAIAEDLGVESLKGLLLHHVPDLRDRRAPLLVEVLQQAREQGLVERIGVSVYDLGDLELALDAFPDLDLLQIPGNVVDRRLLDHELVTDLKKRGVHVLVRSVFLQGLLVVDSESLSPAFDVLAEVLGELDLQASMRSTTRLGLALRFLRDHPNCDGVLVGATSVSEFAEIAAAWDSTEPGDVKLTTRVPIEILDPRKWPR